MASHLVAFHTATSGASGSTLGSDEEDIVLLQYLIWDVAEGKVLTEQQYIVRPGGADVNENLLSEQCREEYGLSEDQVKNGHTLDVAIESFEAILQKLYADDSKISLITDGQLHLRQVLHPKAVAKGFELPFVYHSFFDIRKEAKTFYPARSEFHSLSEIMTYLELPTDPQNNQAVKSVRDMVTIVKKMTGEGHRFAIPEVINIRLEPGICTRSEEVDSGCVVRARGLPWQSSDQDIAKFFRGLNIAKGGVALCLSPQGRRNGEALVRFVSAEHRDMALKRHKHHIGNRYIEVYKATGEDFINVAGGNNNEAQQFLSRGGQVIIRMRGLPYDCTAKQVVEFFEAGENGCNILDGEEGVLFVRKPDGRATGDAFVLFASEEDSAKALAKHREIIGSRYIELFRSTTAEVQQVLNRSIDPRTHEQPQPLIGQISQMPVLPHYITAGSRRDCIRLRGLPYEAQVEHVLEFLGEHAKSIVYRGVHMVINAQGQPSGEAFIQMDGEQSAFLAAQNRHNRYMVFGKKQRYIEVFQCSGEDMNVVLSGGIPAAQRTVVSPGMLMWDQSVGASSPVPQGALATPGLLPPGAPRPPLPGQMIPPTYHPQSFVSTPNGSSSLLPGLGPTPVKAESMLVSNPMISPHLRAPVGLQTPIEMTNHSQAPSAAASFVQSLKPTVTPQTQPIYPTVLGQYGEMNLAPAQGLTHSMVLVPGSKFAAPGISFSPGVSPHMSFVTVSSANDYRKAATGASFQPKYTFSAPSLLPMPYAPPTPAVGGLRVPVSMSPTTTAKRSFEQAFSGDKAAAVAPFRPIKRPPPRLAPPQVAPGTPMVAPRVTTPHLTAAQIQPAHFNSGAPQAPLNAVSMTAPMISALYPPPQMYPPAM